MKYTQESMQQVINLLNSLEIKGIENATRIAMINQILQNPEKEEENGNS